MSYLNQYFLEALSAALFQQELSEPKQPMDWQEFYHKALDQNIAELLYDKIASLPEPVRPDPELLDEWAKRCQILFAFHTSSVYLFETISKKIEMYEHICFKGIYLRELYPVPEYRTMGDIDILIHPEHKQAVEAVLKNFGYENVWDTDRFFLMHRDRCINFQFYLNLEQEFFEADQSLTPEIWKKTKKWKAGSYLPSNEWFLIYLLAHFHKHFSCFGAGIRNLCDVALFLDKYQHDIEWGMVTEKMQQLKITDFMYLIFTCVEKVFPVTVDAFEWKRFTDEQVACALEYMLENGIFGREENKGIARISNQTSKIKTLLYRLFPPKEKMRNLYPLLEEKPYLLILCWIRRIASLNIGTIKRVVMSVDQQNEKDKLFKGMGLK